MTYKEWKNEVIEEYEEYLEFQNIQKQNAKEREEEVKRNIEEFDGPYIEGELEKITPHEKMSFYEWQMKIVKTIDEWIEYGGFINYADTKNGVELYTGEAAEVDYYFWLNEVNEEKLADTISNQKAFCKTALKNANVPSEVIEELLSNW